MIIFYENYLVRKINKIKNFNILKNNSNYFFIIHLNHHSILTKYFSNIVGIFS